MTEIDRRTLFGAMGAGLLLAGCCRQDDKPGKGGKPEKPVGGETCGGAAGDSAGESALWGDSVNRPTPRGVPPGTPLMPDYLCAAYIRFEGTGIVVRQGHVKLTGSAVTSETEQNQIAHKLLAALKSPTAPTDIAVQFPHENFDNFSLNGKQVLVLFVDNDPALARFVSAADMPPPKPGSAQEDFLEHIVRFTQFSGETLGEEVQKNFSFANLKAVTPPLQGFDSVLAYRLDFWNRKMSGQPINASANNPASHYRYSMNIHLRIAAKPGGGGGVAKSFPVILDPDTGNMGSNP